MREESPSDALDVYALTTHDEVQATVGPVSERIRTKARDHLDPITRRFIALSPFLCVGSVNEDGALDVSPRGDPPGFVRVLDDRTILIPERTGNRGLDTLHNVLETGSVGIIFFVPGIGEVMRLNGTARLIGPGSPLLEGLDVRGTQPLSGMVVTVREVFFHCARAIMRGKLWDPDAQIPRSDFPTIGEIARQQMQLDERAAALLESAAQRAYQEENLYKDTAEGLDG